MGWRDARSKLTVVTSVSDQASTGPRGVFLHSNCRIRSASSPSPTIREDETLFITVMDFVLRLDLRNDCDIVRSHRADPEAALSLLETPSAGGGHNVILGLTCAGINPHLVNLS